MDRSQPDRSRGFVHTAAEGRERERERAPEVPARACTRAAVKQKEAAASQQSKALLARQHRLQRGEGGNVRWTSWGLAGVASPSQTLARLRLRVLDSSAGKKRWPQRERERGRDLKMVAKSWYSTRACLRETPGKQKEQQPLLGARVPQRAQRKPWTRDPPPFTLGLAALPREEEQGRRPAAPLRMNHHHDFPAPPCTSFLTR